MSNNQRNPTLAERLDSIIGFFSPDTALRRKASRLSLERMSEAYENVPTWRGSAGWMPVDGQGEFLNAPSRDLARAKARHLERNSEVISSLLNTLERNTVNTGFNLQARTDSPEWNSAVEEVWGEWSEPGNCDITGRYSLVDLLDMTMRRITVDGALLLLKTYNKDKEIPFQLQILEVDELEGPGALKSPQGNPIVNGIEVDSAGRFVAYWIRQFDFETMSHTVPKRYEASDVFFLSMPARPSEIREMTSFTKDMNEIKNLDEFFDAAGFKEKIAAAVSVYITSENSTGPVVGSSIVGGVPSAPKPRNVGERIDPGSIKRLAPGEDVKTLVPSGQSSELTDFNVAVMRRIAAGHGLSYEMVSRDVSMVNYSSARQNLVLDEQLFERLQLYLVQHLLDFVYEEVITSAILTDRLKAPRDFFTNKRKYLKHVFLGQGMPWIDPQKEASADETRVNSLQMTRKELFAARGKDWDEEFTQMLAEANQLKQLADIYTPPEKGDVANGNEKNEDPDE